MTDTMNETNQTDSAKVESKGEALARTIREHREAIKRLDNADQAVRDARKAMEAAWNLMSRPTGFYSMYFFAEGTKLVRIKDENGSLMYDVTTIETL